PYSTLFRSFGAYGTLKSTIGYTFILNCDLIVSLGQVNREIERFFTKKGITLFANADMLFGIKFETILSIGMVRDRRFYDNSFIVISFSKDKLLWFNLSG